MNEEQESIAYYLEREYEDWDRVFLEGCGYIACTDGMELNAIRSNILFFRKALEDRSCFPEIYSRQPPPAVPADYMARKSQIIEVAAKTLQTYLEDENYQYLAQNQYRLDQEQKGWIGLADVLKPVRELDCCIKHHNWLGMRKHEVTAESKRRLFRMCREKMEDIIKELEEMSQPYEPPGTVKVIKQIELSDYMQERPSHKGGSFFTEKKKAGRKEIVSK